MFVKKNKKNSVKEKLDLHVAYIGARSYSSLICYVGNISVLQILRFEIGRSETRSFLGENVNFFIVAEAVEKYTASENGYQAKKQWNNLSECASHPLFHCTGNLSFGHKC